MSALCECIRAYKQGICNCGRFDAPGMLRYEIAARAITRQQAQTEGVSKGKQDAYVETNWQRAHEIVVVQMAAAEKGVGSQDLGGSES